MISPEGLSNSTGATANSLCGWNPLVRAKFSPLNKGYREWYNKMRNDPDMVYIGTAFGEYIEGVGIIHAPLFAGKDDFATSQKLETRVKQFKKALSKGK